MKTFLVSIAFVALAGFAWFQHTAIAQRAVESHSSVPSSQKNRIMVQNYYYAQPDQAENLYRCLLDASDVAEKLGFPRGRLLRRIAMSGNAFGTPAVDRQGPEELPDVVWECEYPGAATRERDFHAVIASPDYEAVHKRFVPLMRKLERATYEISAPNGR
jgi:hypothetical protein